jgi:acyl-CoA synthetase (AMP-forming)/AMP-acid ligase II
MSIAALLVKSATAFGQRPAVAVGRETRLSYARLALRAARFADGLARRHGLVPGDRVALAMKNSAEFMEVLFGALLGGFAVVPINARLHRREFAYILGDSAARLCIATPDLVETVAPLAAGIDTLETIIATDTADYRAMFDGDPASPVARSPAELAWLVYTSGTTGQPKGAMLTHRTLLTMCLSHLADVETISARDAIIHAAPMTHGGGMYIFPHIAKGAVNVIPESGGFDAAELLALYPHYPGISGYYAPTMITRMINHPSIGDADTRNLKTMVYGGGPMYFADLVRALEIFGPKLAQIYGQSEAPMTITSLSKAMHGERDHPRYHQRLASTGIARTDVMVRICDADDRDVAPGEIGEVLVRGDVLMGGYWRRPEATGEVFRGGWLHTGDLGAFDADGFLTLKDRSRDVIISGGSNIYPREVEEVLLRHDAVLEASVIGRAHREWGEETVAFVVPRAGRTLSLEELDRLCLDNIARFKRPRHYRVVEALPKNNYGKVLKTALRERLAADDGAPPGEAGGRG